MRFLPLILLSSCAALVASCDREPVRVSEAAETPERAPSAMSADPLEGPGTVTHANGLVVHTHEVGRGPEALAGDRVTIHYEGSFLVPTEAEVPETDSPESELPDPGQTEAEGEPTESEAKSPTDEAEDGDEQEPATEAGEEAQGQTPNDSEEDESTEEPAPAEDAAPATEDLPDEPVSFVSSRQSGIPVTITVGARDVVRGLDQALHGVRAGARLTIEVPAELAYGTREVGPIPAGASLTFEVQVIKVER